MEVSHLLGSTLGLGLVSGINLYATVLMAGLGIRTELIVLRPEFQQLEVLANPIVIAVAGVMFVVEFLADKIKWIDSLWDAVHTFIRPLGAALLAAAALGVNNPLNVAVALLCGGVALSGHSTKAGLRLLVNHSPEPFSNVALSLVEDGLVVVGTYWALQYPHLMLIIVVVFVISFLWFAPKVFRLLKIETIAIYALFKKLFAHISRLFMRRRHNEKPHGSQLNSNYLQMIANDEMPVDCLYHLKDKFKIDGQTTVIKCAAGKGIRGLRHSVGYLNVTPNEAIFVSKRLLRIRDHAIPVSKIEHVHFKKHILLDRLNLRVEGKQQVIYFFKDASNRGWTISKAFTARTGEMARHKK